MLASFNQYLFETFIEPSLACGAISSTLIPKFRGPLITRVQIFVNVIQHGGQFCEITITPPTIVTALEPSIIYTNNYTLVYYNDYNISDFLLFHKTANTNIYYTTLQSSNA